VSWLCRLPKARRHHERARGWPDAPAPGCGQYEPNAEDLIDGYTVTSATTSECPLVPVKSHDQSRLKPILWSELHTLPKREALIEGLLDCTALSVMFGPSGCGKTFFALDLAAHIALGRPWRACTVLQGAVVYVAAEGGYGIQERLEAFSCQYETGPKGVPFYVIPEPIDLCNSETDVELLIDHLGNLNDQPVRLLVIDTVSRALAGGNENTPDHMGALIKRCDKLRAATGAHVMLLHHTGKDKNQGARGHSSLRAAVDTEIQMKWAAGNSLASPR
jgi:RecA-family ATPase